MTRGVVEQPVETKKWLKTMGKDGKRWTKIGKDGQRWEKISGYFYPDKPYLYLTIGNFYDNENQKGNDVYYFNRMIL